METNKQWKASPIETGLWYVIVRETEDGSLELYSGTVYEPLAAAQKVEEINKRT